MPLNQSAYRKCHSTETAITAVFSNIIAELDQGDLVLLTMLVLSAAFDCVDHEILLNRWKGPMSSNHLHIAGSSPILQTGHNTFITMARCRTQEKCTTVFHRDLYLDPYFFYCTLQTSITLLTTMASDRITTLTTFSFRRHACLLRHSSSWRETRRFIVSMTSPRGCARIVYVSIHLRRSLCGVLYPDACITLTMRQSTSLAQT